MQQMQNMTDAINEDIVSLFPPSNNHIGNALNRLFTGRLEAARRYQKATTDTEQKYLIELVEHYNYDIRKILGLNL